VYFSNHFYKKIKNGRIVEIERTRIQNESLGSSKPKLFNPNMMILSRNLKS